MGQMSMSLQLKLMNNLVEKSNIDTSANLEFLPVLNDGKRSNYNKS